jgi:hypothetical protein
MWNKEWQKGTVFLKDTQEILSLNAMLKAMMNQDSMIFIGPHIDAIKGWSQYEGKVKSLFYV